MEADSGQNDWYITGTHARRAIGYLGAKLAEEDYFNFEMEQPKLLEFWGEALQATMLETDDNPSPIGAAVVSNS